MEKSIKIKALAATAKAFADRTEWIQYDQLSLDREVRVSSRRNDYAPPEAATPQRYLFLDCSSYVWDCFYQTFDYMMESDLTWHIIDHVKPRVFYYEITHQETEEEKKAVCDRVRGLMQPGDTITWQYENGNGHIMLYLGDGLMTHCSYPKGNKYNGYNYTENKNYFGSGSVQYFDIEELFTDLGSDEKNLRYLFRTTRKRFAVSRPLDMTGDVTADAMARIGRAKDLFCTVTCNYPGGKTAEVGAAVEYYLNIENRGKEPVNTEVSFKPGKGSKGEAAENTVQLAAGETKTVVFTAVSVEGESMVMPPEFCVNGLHIDAPFVLCGQNLSQGEADKICNRVSQLASEGRSADAAIFGAYDEAGYRIFSTAKENLRRPFFLHDALSADVLSRRRQVPEKDGCVMTLFGGRGVVTPQVSTDPTVRINYISKDCLQPGDVIVYSADAYFETASECIWTGKSLMGVFEPGDVYGVIDGEEADSFIDKLFGRFCFVVMRPSLTGR